MLVNYNTYNEEKKAFFKKHHNLNCETSSMDCFGRTHKMYIFEDGSKWYEIISPEHISQEVKIKTCKITVEVKRLKTEFWSTDDSFSKYYYEKF